MGEEKKEQVIVEGTLYEFSNDTIHTVTEGFVFEEKGWFSKKLSEHLHDREYYDYEQYANELMAKYYDYYQQIKEIDYEYVLRGAVLTCTHGNKETRLDALKDYGVYFRNQPVMTCKDCELEKNIFSFGACGNGKFEPTYSKDAPPPSRKMLNKNGQERYVCLPILLGEWGYGDIDSRSLLIGEVLIDKMYKVYKKESFDSEELSKDTIEQIAQDQSQNAAEDVEYSQALMTCDNLLCLYGGVITIEENPMNKRMKRGSIRKRDKNDGQENAVEENLYEVDPSDAESVKKYMWNFFVDKGFEEVQVAGILGNVQQESQFNPYNINKNNGNYGLFQLSKDRQERYNKWIESEGLPGEEVVQNQCKFAIEEYDNPADTGWMNRGIRTKETIEYNGQIINYDVVSDGSQEDFLVTDDPVEAAIIWGISFERCFGSKSQNGYYLGIQEQEERCKYALEIYDNRENLYYDE